MVLGALAGVGLGSWLVLAAGLLVAGVGAVRWYQRRNQPACEAPDVGSREVRDERTV